MTRAFKHFLVVVVLLSAQSAASQQRISHSTRAQAEPHIAVNPTDPLNLVATAITQAEGTPNRIECYYTFNGGQTWDTSGNISGAISAGDPAELVNGHVAEGYHTVTWNAADQASGVYFARFTATDADGNSKLNKVSKLVLAR